MPEKNYPVIAVDVSLIAAGGRVSFSYEGANESGKKHVKSNGNIDCAEPADLGNEPVYLQFQLQTPKITLDDIEYDLGFVGRQSVSIKEAREGRNLLPYLFRCLLKALHAWQGQFHGYTNPDANPHRLRFSNLNNDGRRYKYTLRAKAQASGGGAVVWLDDDPMIQNRGGDTGLF